jgi:hypothetical protein
LYLPILSGEKTTEKTFILKKFLTSIYSTKRYFVCLLFARRYERNFVFFCFTVWWIELKFCLFFHLAKQYGMTRKFRILFRETS